jgi:hypothetical protein
VLAGETRVILMVTNACPSETVAWWARAAQARRVAAMLSPRDAQLAEAYALECEDNAREISAVRVEQRRSASLHYVVNPIVKPNGPASPKRVPVFAVASSRIRASRPGG